MGDTMNDVRESETLDQIVARLNTLPPDRAIRRVTASIQWNVSRSVTPDDVTLRVWVAVLSDALARLRETA